MRACAPLGPALRPFNWPSALGRFCLRRQRRCDVTGRFDGGGGGGDGGGGVASRGGSGLQGGGARSGVRGDDAREPRLEVVNGEAEMCVGGSR